MDAGGNFKPVLTRAALVLQQKNKLNDFQALIFEEPKASTKQPSGVDESKADTTAQPLTQHGTQHPSKGKADPQEFDIKQARHEVLRFAMNNQRVFKNKKKMEIFHAVKLGAKPPKKPYKNYKELLDERKRLKEIREERRKFHQLGKNQTGAASVKCRSKTKLERLKKKRAPVTGIDQHYGVVKSKSKKK